MLTNPGIRTAEDRTTGWLRAKKVSGAPVGATIAATVIGSLPYALAVMIAMTAVSLAVAGPVVGIGTTVALVAVLLLGSLPFALLSLAVGFVAPPNAAAAILSAVLFPMVIASGLWFPPEMLPSFINDIAPFLPTYQLAQVALAQLTGADATGNVLALLLMTAVAGALAGWVYRNLRVTGVTDSAARPTRRWGAATLWNLAWLLNLLYQPLLDPTDPPVQWTIVVVIVVVFLPIYLGAELRPGQLRCWAPTLITALAVVAIPQNAGASVLLAYVAAMVGAGRSREVALRWFAGMSALLLVNGVVAALQEPWRLLAIGPSLVLVWVIGLIVAEHTERDRADRFRNAQVEHLATLSERERISRDLHDLLGQTLTGIVVRAQLAQRLARTDADAGIAEMAGVERAARAALGEVRATVSGWRHVDLDHEIAVARDALTASGVELTVVRDPGVVLTPSTETALGLALRESVTNVVRHARATRCAVAVRRTDERIVLEVTDDGVGGELRDGNGLTGMRERIAALGGDVDRQVRGGTAVTVAVPAVVAT